MGHSFGAYVCGNYALKYPQNIKKVILLSPIGIKVSDAAIDDDLSVKENDDIKNNPVHNKFIDDFPTSVRIMLKVVWKRRISPFDVCRLCGEGFVKSIIRPYFADKIGDEYDQTIVGAYTYQIFMKSHGTTEFALLVNFNDQLQAYLPLGTEKKLASEEFSVPVSIVIG